MKIQISPNQPISAVQKQFNSEFEFLKLEFFTKWALKNSDYSAGQLIKTNKKIGEIQAIQSSGEIDIDGKMKVKELEMKLKNDFGLAAQIFRKSGNLWLETTMTDNWSLEQQNRHGKELSTGPDYTTRGADYDLNRDADH